MQSNATTLAEGMCSSSPHDKAVEEEKGEAADDELLEPGWSGIAEADEPGSLPCLFLSLHHPHTCNDD